MALKGSEESQAAYIAGCFLLGKDAGFLTASKEKAQRIFARAKEIIEELSATSEVAPEVNE